MTDRPLTMLLEHKTMSAVKTTVSWTMRARVGPSTLALLGVFWLGTSAGCSVFDASLLPDEGEACVGRRPPARVPGVGMEEDPSDERRVIILRDILVNQIGDAMNPEDDLWQDIGFNLDGFCTGGADPRTECTPPLNGPFRADGEDGIDNVFGSTFFPLVNSALMGGAEEDLVASQERGVGAIMLLIDGWNGERDDARVTVTVMETVAGISVAEGAPLPAGITFMDRVPYLNGVPAPEPVWDGNDFFWANRDNFSSGSPDFPTTVIQSAYVADGFLVAGLPDRTPLRLLGDEIAVEVLLSGLIATGNIYEFFIEPTDPPPAVTVAGRWSYTDMLVQGENLGLCLNDPQQDFLTNFLQASLDVLVSPPAVPDPSLPCNAISAGVTFQAYTGRFAGVSVGQDLVDMCPDTP